MRYRNANYSTVYVIRQQLLGIYYRIERILSRIPDKLRLVLFSTALLLVFLLNSNDWALSVGERSDDLRWLLVITSWSLIALLFGFLSFWMRLLKIGTRKHLMICPVYLFALFSLSHFSLPFMPLNPFGLGANYIPTLKLTSVVLVGITSITIGCYLGKSIRITQKERLNSNTASSFGNLNLTIGIALLSIGAAATIVYFFGQGIPIINYEIRETIDPFLNGLIGLLLVGGIFLLTEIKRCPSAYWILAGSIFLIFLVKTVRYELFVVMISILLISVFRRSITLRRLLIIILFFLFIVAALGAWRTIEAFSPWWITENELLLYSPYVSADHTYRDLNYILDEVLPFGVFHGRLAADTILPLLPGTQTAATFELSDLILSQPEKYPGYKSTSLHLSSYAYMAGDFGWIGIISISAIFGFITGLYYERARKVGSIYLPIFAVSFAWLLQGSFGTIYRPEVFLLNITAVIILLVLRMAPERFLMLFFRLRKTIVNEINKSRTS